jgi:hypothetical protein
MTAPPAATGSQVSLNTIKEKPNRLDRQVKGVFSVGWGGRNAWGPMRGDRDGGKESEGPLSKTMQADSSANGGMQGQGSIAMQYDGNRGIFWPHGDCEAYYGLVFIPTMTTATTGGQARNGVRFAAPEGVLVSIV